MDNEDKSRIVYAIVVVLGFLMADEEKSGLALDWKRTSGACSCFFVCSLNDYEFG